MDGLSDLFSVLSLEPVEGTPLSVPFESPARFVRVAEGNPNKRFEYVCEGVRWAAANDKRVLVLVRSQYDEEKLYERVGKPSHLTVIPVLQLHRLRGVGLDMVITNTLFDEVDMHTLAPLFCLRRVTVRFIGDYPKEFFERLLALSGRQTDRT